MARIDLHLHTTFSDGSLLPREVVALAHKAGVTALAITDHDITDGIPEAIISGKDHGIEVVPGVEISSRFQEREIHILGYYLDYKDSVLQLRLAQLRKSRYLRNAQIIEKLNALGLSISYQDVRAMSGSDSVGRPHIAQVLLNQGYVRSPREAFDRYLAQGAAAYTPRILPDANVVMGWIREAGGVSVLAHPSWARSKGEGLQEFFEALKEEGLKGIEVFYSSHSPRETSQYLEIARRLDLVVTGGSDFHGDTKPDISVGTGRGDLKVPEKLIHPLKEAAASL